jgi:hypothetical protein
VKRKASPAAAVLRQIRRPSISDFVERVAGVAASSAVSAFTWPLVRMRLDSIQVTGAAGEFWLSAPSAIIVCAVANVGPIAN